MRPLIGLNTSLLDISNPLKAKSFCLLKYIDAISLVGGIPIIIPPYTDMTLLDEALAPLNGFCLIGGDDYHPAAYGGHPQTENLLPARRHDFDLCLAKLLLEKSRLPVLGICGGHQLISIAAGGALIQDLKTEGASTVLPHADSYRKNMPQEGADYRHEAQLAPNSRIAQIIGAQTVMTNSHHHQAVQTTRVGNGLIATAWTSDGVLEAIESVAPERFILGAQWHPERQITEPPHRAIFEALIVACLHTMRE